MGVCLFFGAQAHAQDAKSSAKGSKPGGAGDGAAPGSSAAASTKSGDGDEARGGAGDGKTADTKERIVGGYSYSDKGPARRTYVAHAPNLPTAHYPSFSMTDARASRLTVTLSKQVQVEEKKAPGAIVYLLRGARVARWNDTNALIAVHFNTPLAVARLRNVGKDVELRLEMRAPVTPTFSVTPGKDAKEPARLVVDFPAGEYLAEPINGTSTTGPVNGGASSPPR
jgi:hypothetical protein